MTQIAFYFDQERCIGCHACSVACKDKNDLPPFEVYWRQVHLMERGKYPHVRALRLSLSCNHCAQPACAAACPVGAISKREGDGIVLVDRDLCLGGDVCERYCLQACPYDIPQYGKEPNPRMQKCDFCLDRWGRGDKPVCVESCPMLALDAGPLEELERRYETTQTTEGMPDTAGTCPSLRFRQPKSWSPAASGRQK